MKNQRNIRWPVLILPLLFVGAALGFLAVGVIPNVYDWQQMKSWPQVEARLLDAELERGSKTYRATARYEYRYEGVVYISERVAIMGGSDIGRFQETLGYALESALQNQQPVPAWVNPHNPSDAVLNRDMRWPLLILKSVLALIFGGLGIRLVVRQLYPKIGATGHPESVSKPWLGQREWANSDVNCDTKKQARFFWGFALLWNMLTWPILVAIPEELSRGNKLIVLAVIFPLVGIYLVYLAIKSTLSWRRFGNLRLHLDPYPGSIGGQVGGSLRVPLAYDSRHRFNVNLLCLRSQETGNGKHRRRRETGIWQASGLAHNKAAPGGGTLLTLCFDLPPGLPISEPHSDDYHFWRLELKADLPGIDLMRQFTIPVFATGEKSQAGWPLSTQDPQLQSEREAKIEAITQIKPVAGGVTMHFPMLQGWDNHLVGLVVGLFCMGAAMLLHQERDTPAIVLGGLILSGIVIVLLCLKWLFTSLHARLDHNGLISQRYWLGIPMGSDKVARSDIRHLALSRGARWQSLSGYKEYFKIYAHTRQGKTILVARDLDGRDIAQMALESIGLLTGYRITEQPE